MTDPATTDTLIAALTAGASIVSAIAASVAAVGIWRGIGAMISANKDRAAQMERLMTQQREADERRHAEAMAALNELIRAGQRQGEALERQGAALERQGAALDELLRRPAHGPAPAE